MSWHNSWDQIKIKTIGDAYRVGAGLTGDFDYLVYH